MRMQKCVVYALIVSVWIVLYASAQAADSLKFTETYKESLKKLTEDGETFFVEVVESNLSISGKISLSAKGQNK